MKKFAIVENGIVVNLIESTSDFVESNGLEAILETKETGIAYIGANLIAGKFVLPEEIIEANKGSFDLEIRQQIDAAILEKEAARQAVLSKLGLTAEEAAALLA